MKKVITAVILWIISGISMWLFRCFPSFFFPAYRSFSKAWIGFLAGLSGHVPFAVWDIGAVVLAAAALISLVSCIVRKQGFLRCLSWVFLIVSVLAFSAINGWMLNHYAPKLSEELGLELREYSVRELEDAAEYYLQQAGNYALQSERDTEGHLVHPDFETMAVTAGSSYDALSESYPVFAGSTARVKRLSLIGEYLMYNGIIGMFMPITGESGVPASVPDAVMPFTMTHEAGHRLGLAGEEEANFAAFLACTASDDLRFLYSGYYEAFSYCFSALYRTDAERAAALLQRYEEDEGVRLVRLDRADTASVYARYESPLQDVSDRINDTYLKTFNEDSGIASYGEVTAYLIAWYLNGRQ